MITILAMTIKAMNTLLAKTTSYLLSMGYRMFLAQDSITGTVVNQTSDHTIVSPNLIITETGLRVYKELMPMKKENLDLCFRVTKIPAGIRRL
jgi:hypothetical protein